MSEGKRPYEFTNSLTDKTFDFNSYVLWVDGLDGAYKMDFSTFFSGILAPDGSGDIDVGNNNFINVGNITGLNMTFSGQLIVNGEAKNEVSPFISFKIDDGAGSPGTTITAIDNHVISAWTIETPPPSGQTGNYFEIPNGKCSQLFKIMYNIFSAGTFVLRFYIYDRVLETYTDSTLSITISNDSTSSELIIQQPYIISKTLTADEDIRVFVQTGFANIGVDICTIWALQ